MPKALDDTPWTGTTQLVVGLDIGTAHSSVTFSHLEYGQIPQQHRVTHWPAATGIGGSSDAKTASMLYYDKNCKVKSTGIAGTSPTMRRAAKSNGWHLVRYFKLLLHPPRMVKQNEFHVEVLPTGLSIEQVYADMIRYMLDHTRDFHEQRYGMGKWEELSSLMALVIARPNGWGLAEQERLRSAVTMAGVMSASASRKRVTFVSEAEAAVHYILWEKSRVLQPGDRLIVCDAGGSTVDTTAYSVQVEPVGEKAGSNGSAPSLGAKRISFGNLLKMAHKTTKHVVPANYPPPKPAMHLKEVKGSDCQPAGGVFVNEALVAYLKDRFYDLPPDQADRVEECIRKAEESFELSCKREFTIGEDAPPEYVVEMGGGIPGYMDSSIVIDAETVQGFFEEPVNRIIASIEKQMRGVDPQYIFLVGGFGTSKYLRQRVKEVFGQRKVQILFLDNAHGKAASDGSIIWYIRKNVTARATRMSFGIKLHDLYDANSPEHQLRRRVTSPTGESHVNGKWDLVAGKDSVFGEKSSTRRNYYRAYPSPDPELGYFMVELFAWTNDAASPPEWVIDPEGNVIDGFELICKIEADLSGMKGCLVKQPGRRGDFWVLEYDVCIELGAVELSAYLEWNEKGMTRRSEAKIVVTSS